MMSVETLASKQVYTSPWMTVREDSVRRGDGSEGTYAVVDSPDIATVIAAEGDRLHLVEQYRYPVGGRRWEFPSGTTDDRLDADPAALAARELREETGLVADDLRLLGTVEISPSTLNQRCRVFLATGLTEGEPDREADEQDMRSAWFTRREVEELIHAGQMCDAKSLAAYSLALLSGVLGPVVDQEAVEQESEL